MKSSLKKKKAFTLIELLAVIVIMGIIAAITIPSVLDLMQKQKEDKYASHQTIVEQAVDAYTDQYGEDFNGAGDCACYKIPYQALLADDLIKEDDITCDVTQDNEINGVVLAYPLGNGAKNFRYEYYLTCRDKETGTIVHKAGNAPSGCCGVNGNFVITNIILKYDNASGEDYPQTDDNWTNRSVYQQFEANDPYMAGISGYEYSTDGGVNWTFVSGNNFTFSQNIESEIQVRAVNNDGNRSTVVKYSVRIDKTAPVLNLTTTSTSIMRYTNKLFSSYVSSSSDNLSGVKRTWATIGSTTYTNVNQIGNDGTFTVVFYTEDNAGNVTTRNLSLNVYYTVTKYRTRQWIVTCSDYCQVGVPPESTHEYHRCTVTDYICAYNGTWYPAGGCPGPGIDNLPISHCCSTYCNGGYWTAWSSWTTTWCAASNSCEVQTRCAANSPAGACNII